MFKSKFSVSPLTKESVYTLNNGMKIPVLGFGTWQIRDDEEAYNSVLEALRVGYRHIDTAEVYRNEEAVGRAMKDSGIPREEIFLTTKIWNTHTTYDEALAAIEERLVALDVSYIDLLLIHWPNPSPIRPDHPTRNAAVYKAMEDAHFAGKIKALGVSNFHRRHLEPLLKHVRVKPVINQIYLSPSDQQRDVVLANDEFDIVTSAYSPLGTGKLLDLPLLSDLSKKYKKSAAQILLSWSLAHGYLPLPKSVTPSRIKENYDIFDFTLSVDDIKAIDNLAGIVGYARNPDTTEY